ncbi:hypothetical protein Aperf_G00000126347 [Anoplocephala perfoliata]
MIAADAAKKISQAALAVLEDGNVYGSIISYVLQKYAVEISMVTDSDARFNIVNDRVGTVLEDIGVINELSDMIKALGLTNRLKELQEEKSFLRQKQIELVNRLNTMTSQLIDLQSTSFGQVEFKIDTLPDIDSVEIMNPENFLTESTMTSSAVSAMKLYRPIRPDELLLGIRGFHGLDVFVQTDSNSWIKGVIENVIDRDEPLSLIDLNRHATDGGVRISPSERLRFDSRTESSIRYLVSSESDDFRDSVDPSRLALGMSSAQLTQRYPVGARVVALYEDAVGVTDHFSGIVGEPPKCDNEYRYLIFFDDGYAYYAQPNCVFRIFGQSKENWQAVNRNFREFMKNYLHMFPKRPMVKLNVDQVIRTQLNGNWLQAKVARVDSSMVLLQYPSGNLEWIYRGSDRLGPIIFNNDPRDAPPAENTVLQSVTGRRRYTGRRSTAAGAVVYSIAGSQPGTPSEHSVRPSIREALVSGVIKPYMASLKLSVQIKPYVDHKCVCSCLQTPKNPDDPSLGFISENPLNYKGLNPLEIPLRAGWTRAYIKATPAAAFRDVIVYMAPCGRQIRCFSELEHFLYQTNSQLTSDLFTFDKEVKIDEEFCCEKAFIRIADISYKKENVPIPCVNSLDNESPTYMDYTTHRIPFGKVKVDEDPGFMVCCDCTDNCRDKTRCACQQLTLEASGLSSDNGFVDGSAGYRHRRLLKHHRGSVYECNPGCKCDRRCQNRVVQHGLWLRLQVFKTRRKGWGIRALNAIPKGTFICTYAGHIYDDSAAVSQGKLIGDEYQADLDYIEVVESEKEGYEENVVEPEADDEVALRPSTTRSSRTARKSNPSRSVSTRRNSVSSASSASTKPSAPDADNSPEAQPSEEIVAGTVESGMNISQELNVNDSAADAVAAVAISDSNEQEPMDTESLGSSETLIPSPTNSKPAGLQFTEGISNLQEILNSTSFKLEPLLQLTKIPFPFTSSPARRGRRPMRGHGAGRSMATKHSLAPRGPRQAALSGDIKKSTSIADIVHSASQSEGPRRSSSATDLLHTGRGSERRIRGKSAVVVVSSGGEGRREIIQATGATTGPVPWANRRSYPIRQSDWVKARAYFGDVGPFVMDAKRVGNLGRYFNHSCQPNIFAQSVFSSTHDPRFPDVAFFAARNIEAGEELTWDYGYVKGSVPSKMLYCYCNESLCRKQLL